VAGVEVRVNGGAFQPATGAATWAYLLVTEGSYTIQSRATDVAGNVETPGAGITVRADATPPNVTLNALPATPSVPTRNAGQWSVTLSGTASDPNIGGQSGSGVQPDSVEVLLVAQAGDDDAQGNGWQQATLNGNNWTLDYRFADALPDPTGVYTVYVRADERVGNHTSDNAATGTLRLDGGAPLATLSDADAIGSILTDTVTIGGVITDTGPAGVGQVQISFMKLEQIAALPSDVSSDQAQTLLDAAGRAWLPATVAQTGAAVTTWSAQVPANLEGEYQIGLRASDTLNNRRPSPNVWRWVIDTRAPRLVMEGTYTGDHYYDEAAGVERYRFVYTCSAEERYLVEQDFACAGSAFQPPQRAFTEDAAVQALFSDRTILSRLAITYSQRETSLQPLATVSACDAFGHCTTTSNQQQTANSN
jgi:hypothetical protein